MIELVHFGRIHGTVNVGRRFSVCRDGLRLRLLLACHLSEVEES